MAWKEERTLSLALTLQYDKVMLILEPSEQAQAAIGKRVTVVDYPDGRLAIRYRGGRTGVSENLRQNSLGLAGRDCRKQTAQRRVAFVRDQQLRREPERRSGPRRRD